MTWAVIQARDGWLAPGTRIEVLGFAYRDSVLMVVWRDEAGYVHDTPASNVRIEPWVQDKAA